MSEEHLDVFDRRIIGDQIDEWRRRRTHAILNYQAAKADGDHEAANEAIEEAAEANNAIGNLENFQVSLAAYYRKEKAA